MNNPTRAKLEQIKTYLLSSCSLLQELLEKEDGVTDVANHKDIIRNIWWVAEDLEKAAKVAQQLKPPYLIKRYYIKHSLTKMLFSEEYGWVARKDDAEVFTENEMLAFHLPEGANWIMEE